MLTEPGPRARDLCTCLANSTETAEEEAVNGGAKQPSPILKVQKKKKKHTFSTTLEIQSNQVTDD